jgi:hypothetical protein
MNLLLRWNAPIFHVVTPEAAVARPRSRSARGRDRRIRGPGPKDSGPSLFPGEWRSAIGRVSNVSLDLLSKPLWTDGPSGQRGAILRSIYEV